MPGRMRAREAAIVAAGLVVLCAVAYGPHVFDGGFYWDDWQLAARARFPPLHSADFSGPIDLSLLAYRPLLALLLPGVHALLGLHPAAHILLGLVLNVLTALCFFAYLRELRVPAFPAGLMAALTLIFPWSDSMRLWATASINTVGVILYLLGTIAALRGLGAGSPRRRRLLGAIGVVLVVLGVLTYEVAAAAALLSVFLYAREVPRRVAVRRWLVDVVAVVAAAGFVALNTPRRKESLAGMVDHGFDILRESASLLARAVEPFGAAPRGLVLVAVAALVAAALILRSRLAPGSPARAELGRWLLLAGAGAVAVLASYALLVPADGHYLPLAPGVNNRINLLAALPYAVLVVALAMLAGTLALGRGERSATGPALLATGLCAVVGAGWLHRTIDDRRAWDRAAADQDRVLQAIEAAVPDDRPRGSTLYTFGAPTYAADQIPVFSVSWDLKGAARLRLDDRSLTAYAIDPRGQIACRPERVEPLGPSYEPRESAAYGRAFFVDVPARGAVRIDGRAQCERERARLLPGYR
jgi:hypothetical protein